MTSGEDARPSEHPSDYAGVEDGFGRLWTPHRLVYLKGQGKPPHDEAGEACPFCRVPGVPDEEGLIVARGERVYAVLNLYPYNAGHLMLVPYRHVAQYDELDRGELTELGEFTQTAMRVLRATLSPHGFNIGMNQGAIGGAGIAAHLHQHVVPRWGGDSNFMPIVAQTRVLAQTLSDTRRLLHDEWSAGRSG